MLDSYAVIFSKTFYGIKYSFYKRISQSWDISYKSKIATKDKITTRNKIAKDRNKDS